VVADHAIEVVEMRDKVEHMWKTCSSKRERRTLASQMAPGCSLYGDNIGQLLRIVCFSDDVWGHKLQPKNYMRCPQKTII
jgi:hypothetical protein